MLISQHYLSDGATRMRSIERQLRGNADIDSMKSRLYAIGNEMVMAAEEIYATTADQDYNGIKMDLINLMMGVQQAEDIESLRGMVSRILEEQFPEDRPYHQMVLNDFRRSVMQAVTQYAPISPINMEMVSRVIDAPGRSLNIIDPRCRDGQNAEFFRKLLPESTLYGVEMEAHMSRLAKTRMDRVATGSLNGSRITNDAFDIMLIEAPISWNLVTAMSTSVKQEKVILQNTIKYVRPQGVVVFIIPYYRMYKDMCVMISKLLDNVQVRKLAGPDFDNRGLIAIVGQKSSNKEPDQDTYRMLRQLHGIEDIPSIVEQQFEKITLPQRTLAIDTFRGSILDADEMKTLVENSGCYGSFWDRQSVEKLSENVKQPLLPFNIGQIGLVLTSGCLDGIVDEGDGHYHVIKGRVSKKTVTQNDILDPNNLEVNETISNRVEINVMLPNGEFKVLA